MTVFEIEVVFDFVCAWCYIGKRNLEQAIKMYQKTYPGGKSDTFAIAWRPYYLNYHPSTDSIDKSELAKEKLADMSADDRDKLTKRMERIGASVGINFKCGGKIGSTRDAHRLVRLAGSESPDVQQAVVDGLFAAYHEEERDIVSLDVLCDVAGKAGMDVEETRVYLATDQGSAEVDEEAVRNKERVEGSGVPTLIIQSIHKVSGAQDFGDIMEVLVQVKGEEAKTG